MSTRLNKLLEKRGQIADQMDAILEKASKDNSRDLTEEEKKAFDDLDADLKRVEEGIAFEKRVEEAKAASARPLNQGDASGADPSQPKKIIVPAQARHRFAKLKAFKSEEDAYISGMFLLAALGRGLHQFPNLQTMGQKAVAFCRDHGIDVTTRAHNEGSSTAGGYLVIPQFEQAIIDLREEYGTFRRLVGVTPMSSETQTQPKRTGGLTAYWVDEAAQITESEKSWGQVSLAAKKLAALSRFSSELNEDAIISIADDLAREMAYAFAVAEDAAGWNGDGTSSYGGITGLRPKIIDGNHGASAKDAASGHDTFAEYDKTDLETVEAALPTYVKNPRWYCSQPFWIQVLRRIASAAGGVTWTEMANGQRVPMYNGYPVEIDQTLPKSSTDNTVDAFFGDISLSSKMGERRGITISLSDQRYWEYDQVGIKATERVHIVHHTLGDGSTAGPIIALVAE
jgi:HK97 family phage major capsid protein